MFIKQVFHNIHPHQKNKIMKANIIKVVIGLLVLTLFNVLFFLFGGTQRSTTEWVCYGFIHIAFFCLAFTHLFFRARKGETVLTASLHLWAIAYFIAELATGIVFLWYNPASPFWPVAVQSTLLVIFLVFQMMGILANDDTKASLAKQRGERVYIQSLAENLREAMRQVNDPSLRNQMIVCYESLSNCSLESFPEAMDAERELEDAVNTLCASVCQDNTTQLNQQIQRVFVAIKLRNHAIRMART